MPWNVTRKQSKIRLREPLVHRSETHGKREEWLANRRTSDFRDLWESCSPPTDERQCKDYLWMIHTLNQKHEDPGLLQSLAMVTPRNSPALALKFEDEEYSAGWRLPANNIYTQFFMRMVINMLMSLIRNWLLLLYQKWKKKKTFQRCSMTYKNMIWERLLLRLHLPFFSPPLMVLGKEGQTGIWAPLKNSMAHHGVFMLYSI